MSNMHTDELLRMVLQELKTQNDLSRDILKKLDNIDGGVMLIESEMN
ncbi:hypothetical protein [Brevibacterium sediminis]